MSWMVSLLIPCAAASPLTEAPPVAADIDLDADRPQWVGADCRSTMLWDRAEWGSLAALVRQTSSDAAGERLAVAIEDLDIPRDLVFWESVRRGTPPAASDLLGRFGWLVAGIVTRQDDFEATSRLAESLLPLHGGCPLAPWIFDHVRDRELLLRTLTAQGPLAVYAARKLRCDDAWIRSAPADTLPLLMRYPAQGPGQLEPVLFRMAELGSTEAFTTELLRLDARLVGFQSCDPRLHEGGCRQQIDRYHALAALLPAVPDAVRSAHPRFAIQTAVAPCSPLFCGEVEGMWAHGRFQAGVHRPTRGFDDAPAIACLVRHLDGDLWSGPVAVRVSGSAGCDRRGP